MPYGVLEGSGGQLAGTLDSGDPLDNHVYSDGGRIILEASASVPLSVASVLLNDADSHSVSSWDESRSAIHLRNAGCGLPDDVGAACPAPGSPTMLNILSNGAAGSLSVHDSSYATLSGGIVGTRLSALDAASIDLADGYAPAIDARDDSTVKMAGGAASAVAVYDSATFTLSSGVIDRSAYAYDSAQMVVSGGSLSRYSSFRLYDHATAEISGGVHHSQLETDGASALTLSGGSLDALRLAEFSIGSLKGGTSNLIELRDASEGTLAGGLIQNTSATPGTIILSGTATLTITGYDFGVGGVPVGYGPLDALSGELTGQLESGESLDVNFVRDDGRIVLSDTVVPPAPSARQLLNNGGNWSLPSWDHAHDQFLVRNLGCGIGTDPTAACGAPGPPTTLALAVGGAVGGLSVFDRSSLTLDGGIVGGDVDLYGEASALLDGAKVWGRLRAHGTASIRVDSGRTLSYLEAHDASLLDVHGGELGDVSLDGTAHLVFGDSASAYSIDARGDAQVTLMGGTVDDEVDLYERASLDMSGGQLLYDVIVSDSSQIAVSGGLLDYGLEAHDLATVTLSGGTLNSSLYVYDQAQATVTGGAFTGFSARNASTISIVGSGFALDGHPVGLGPLAASSGQLTGTLQSGEPLDAFAVSYDPTATIELVPEPSLALLQLGALLMLGLHRRRNRRL